MSSIGWIAIGALAGLAWGIAALLVNLLFIGAEAELAHNIATFMAGGAVMGAVTAGALSAFDRIIPFKGLMAKAVFVSVAIWLILRVGGAALSSMEPDRYHVLTTETLTGLVLSFLLGIFIWGVARCAPGLIAKGA